MTPDQLEILYIDNHLLAINKPAGLPTMGAAAGRESLITVARQYIKVQFDKPGNVYLGVVSRLDAPVTGVVLFARTSKAAERLNRQFAGGTTQKTYWAIVEHPPSALTGSCTDWLWHDDAHQRVVVVPPRTAGAKEARLEYRTLRQGHVGSLLEIDLQTGRKHQIRVQLAHRGWPVWGDTKYGAQHTFAKGIALHARRLEFQHPVQPRRLVLETPPPRSWRSLGIPLD